MVSGQESTRRGLAVVTGAGGFIGGHLVASLLGEGHHVRAVDVKPLSRWYQVSGDAENQETDLKLLEECHKVVAGAEYVYNLAADMGGIGFIETHKTDCMLSVLINTHMLVAARRAGVARFFFSSSACVYNVDRQQHAAAAALREEDAYPALPEDGYGWEKLFSERMCQHFGEEGAPLTRVARYHNVYGPLGAWDGGREKAPAAICRKVAQASLSGQQEIEIWGDGEQTRSFMYIADCVRGTRSIMDSEIQEPINLGSDQLVSINQVVDLVEEIAGVKLTRKYILDAPKGVRGRNSDNTRINRQLGWAPSTTLAVGLEKTYGWIFDQVRFGRRDPVVSLAAV